MKDTYHVYPVNDKLEHNTKGITCLCHPKIEINSDGKKLVIHNSFDGREYFEKGTKLLIN